MVTRFQIRYCALTAIACVSAQVFAQGDPIFESASLGPVGRYSALDLSAQFLGARFHLDSAAQVQAIGGNIWGFDLSNPGTLFGAIVGLDGASALPSGNPFDDTTIAVTTFSPPSSGADLHIPLSASLLPGDYGLVFGGQGFGASGRGEMPFNNSDLPGQASYFKWDYRDQQWKDIGTGFGESGLRFVVYGVLVPEPSTWALLSLGVGSVAVGRWRRRAQ